MFLWPVRYYDIVVLMNLIWFDFELSVVYISDSDSLRHIKGLQVSQIEYNYNSLKYHGRIMLKGYKTIDLFGVFSISSWNCTFPSLTL